MNKKLKKILIKLTLFVFVEILIFTFLKFISLDDGLEVTVPYIREYWIFMRPNAFYLMFIPPFLILLPALSDLSYIQKFLMFLTRFTLFFILITAIAKPVTKTQEPRLALFVVLDTSKSIDDVQLQYADKVISNLLKVVPSGVKLNFIKFDSGAEQIKVSPLTKHIFRTNQGKEETNIVDALRLVLSLISSGYSARMLLISDGLETKGKALTLVPEFKKTKIPIYYYFPKTHKKPEVFISKVDIPSKVRIKHPFELVATVVSNVETEVGFSLYQGTSPEEMLRNDLDFYKKKKLKPGVSTVKFKVQVNELGIQALHLVMNIKNKNKDTIRKNNDFWTLILAKDKPRVLYVEGHPSKGRYFVQALKSSDIDVEVRSSWGFPASITQMKRYSCIIQSDVPVNYVSTGKMLKLKSYIMSGGCYIMVGGENSFGSGGYYQTPIERLLPVRFDLEKNKRQPSVALALVIDRSGSMSGMKMRLAKEAAISTSTLLGARDLIGVVVFDSAAQVIVDLTYAANKSRIEQLIRKIQAAGGTDIVGGLELATPMLCNARAKRKHIILLSDGQSGRDRLENVLQEAEQCNITISVVGIGSDVDKGMLNLIKEKGHGRSYYTNDPNDLPRIFTKEASKIARPPLVDEPIKVKEVKKVNFLRNIDISKAPYLLGYVPVKPKKNAEVILVSDVFGDPILVRWNLGLGKAIAFTSDVKPRWSRQWIESWSDGFQKFWVELLKNSMKIKKLEEYSIYTKQNGKHIAVSVEATGNNSRWRNFLESYLYVEKFGGNYRKKYSLHQTAPGLYQTNIDLPSHGTYMLTTKHYCNPKIVKNAGFKCPGEQCPCFRKKLLGEAFYPVSFAYSKELSLVQPPYEKCLKSAYCKGLELMKRLSSETNGFAYSPKTLQKFIAPGTQKETFYKSRWYLLLFPFLILFILDLLFRRVRIFGFSHDD